MKNLLLTLGLWLVRLAGREVITVPTEAIPLIPLARIYINTVEAKSAEGTSGEYKRHVVYAAILKDFERRRISINKKHVALAIELAMH